LDLLLNGDQRERAMEMTLTAGAGSRHSFIKHRRKQLARQLAIACSGSGHW